jgi:hypothetical protein
MRVSLRKEKNMEKASILLLMEKFIKVDSKMAFSLERAS